MTTGQQSQAPWQPPQQQAPKRRHRGLKITLGVVGALIVIIILAAVLGSGGNGGSSASGGGSGSTAAHIGDKVRDGKFQFTITKVTHARRVGGAYLNKTAQGRYTIVSVRVTNIGSQTQTLDDSSQYAFDASGRKFTADSTADIYMASGQHSTWLQDINPGNTVTGKIAFDMPRGDKAVKVEVHDSAFSDGVTVRL